MVNFFKNAFKKKLPPSATTTLGTTGTVLVGGFLFEDELNAALTGRAKYVTFSNILANTAIVSAGVRFYLNLITRAKWKVEPKSIGGIASDEAKRLADLVEDIMNDMATPWHRIVRRAAMFRFYGFSVQEWTAKQRDDGVIGYLDIMPRPQVTIERWQVDETTGRVTGMFQRTALGGEELFLPRCKTIYMVDDSLNDSPEGLGIFRHLVEPEIRLTRYKQLEGFGFESDLRGIPIGRVPFAELEAAVKAGEITKADANKRLNDFLEFMNKHQKNPSLGLTVDSLTYQTIDEAERPSNVRQWDLELLRSGATSQEAVAAAIQRTNQEMARLLGVEGMLLGSNTLGSQALSSDKSKNFAMTVDSALLELSETFKKDFLGPLWLLNGWDMDLIPDLKPEAVQFRDIQEITGALVDLAKSGATILPNDPVVDNIRDMMGIAKQTAETMSAPQPNSEEPANGLSSRNE